MILDATYITETDVGSFYSEAKFNCLTGDIFDIDQVEDEEVANIRQLLGTKISVVYEKNSFILNVNPQEDMAISYKETELYRLVKTKKYKDDLEKDLTPKEVKHQKLKI